MYKPDCLKIAKYAQESPSNLFDVGLFVQCTINQHFEQVPRIVQDFRTYELECKYLMGWQRTALITLKAEQESLHLAYRQWRRHGRNAAKYALMDIVQLPGFGIVKAAFFAQLLLPGTEVGCLDRHNIRLYGLNERAFNHIPASAEGLSKKIDTYLTLCRKLGGAEKLWDTWVTHVSQLRPKVFPTPDSVSKLHVECIVR